MNDKTAWYNNHENLELLACYLVETLGYHTTTLLMVLGKPWHWEYEFKKAQEDSSVKQRLLVRHKQEAKVLDDMEYRNCRGELIG